jgi:hypothetical protein
MQMKLFRPVADFLGADGAMWIAFCFLLGADTACHHPERFTPPPSTGIEILSEYDIPLPDVVGAVGMATNDDGRLFILDSSGPFYLYLIDLNHRAVSQKFGRAGDGPGELSGPESLQLVREPTPHLWVMQANRRLMTSYDITAAPVFSRAQRFESRIPIFGAIMLPSGMVVSGAIRNGGALTAGDSTFHSQRPWGKAPYLPEELPPVLVFNANWAFVAANPKATKIAAVFLFAAEIQVIDTTGTVLRRIRPAKGVGHPNLLSPKFNTTFASLASDIAYLAVAASDSTVVAVYCGCQGRVLRAGTGPTHIQIYRWDGSLIGDVVIPKHITNIAVSRDGHTIYYVANTPEPTVTVLTVGYRPNGEHH